MPADELTPEAFVERRRSGELWQLLDVREAWELELAGIPGAVHIPMSEVVGRHGELHRDQPVAVLCHSGVRSAQVANYLLAQGFGTVANIVGGIDAWSTDLDPSVPRY